MARRVRHDKRRRVVLTASRAMALTLGPDPFRREPDDVLYAVWLEHRDDLLDSGRHDRRPWAWWAWEPGVPDDLRGTAPVLVPVAVDEPAAEDPSDLEDRRAAWLSGSGRAPG